MCSDHHLGAAGCDCSFRFPALCHLHAAGQQRDLDTERGKEFFKCCEMLGRENFGRCHQSGLMTVCNDLIGGKCGN